MEFLNPAALYGLLALPLLLIPYLIRRKPQRVIFSSLLLFTEPVKRAGGRPLGRLRLPLIFFLQLLLLTLLILTLGEPVFSLRASIFTLPHRGWKECASPPLNRPKLPLFLLR